MFIVGCAGSLLLHGRFSSCEQGLFSSGGAWASHRGGFFYCRARALGPGLQELQRKGSEMAAPWF